MQLGKIKIVAIIVAVLMMTSITNVLVNAASIGVGGPLPAGKTPAAIIPTRAYLSFTPNPIGVNQELLINFWLAPSVSTGMVAKDYHITFTKPDGTTVVIVTDAEPSTTAQWLPYVPDQVGTWTIKFDFPGTYFNGTTNEATQSFYMQPASTAAQNLTVLPNFVWSYPPSPLPTDYWTRPVDFIHREWWTILGNYPATGYDGTDDPQWSARYPGTNPLWSSQYEFTPWVPAPNSAHIVWKEQTAIDGLMGGQAGFGTGQQSGASTTGSPDKPSLIYGGRAYQTVTKPMLTLVNGTYITTPQSAWECYDIRTGHVYWDLTNVPAPTIIEYTYRTGDQNFDTSASAALVAISNNRLIKYNAFTGAVTLNMSIPVTGTYYRNKLVLAVQDIGNTTNPNYRLINWTTTGTSTDWNSRVISNTSYARSSLPTLIDWNVGLGATVTGVTANATAERIGQTVQGFNLYTGQSLWNVTNSEPQYSGSCAVADHGKIAILSMYGYWVAYDLYNGALAWKSEAMDYPWGSSAFGVYGVQSAYGMLFREAYDALYAFNWTNGKIVWKYHSYAVADFESPYTDGNGTEVYSTNTGARIADGKIYSYNCEHTQTWPRTRGWQLYCLNITTGEEIWSIEMAGGAAFGETSDIAGIADGYMAMATANGFLVYFGKGLSATTVTAPDIVIPKGNGIVIKGTVLDQSPAQPNTPCVSQDSMRLQMEYLHLQASIKGLWGNETVTGVPVTLTAIDSNGNVLDIGTATTNGYYGTYSYTWTPPNEGNYQIIASFAGDNSYGSSGASTAVSVGPAPTTAPTSTQQPVQAAPDNTGLIYATFAAVIVAIIIGLVAVLLTLRKR